MYFKTWFNILASLLRWISLLFKENKYDVLFYFPQHFNENDSSSVRTLQTLINCCKENNMSYILVEEPDQKCRFKKNKYSIPFDFFWFIILFRRKFIHNTTIHKIDRSTGHFLRRFFFRKWKVKNVITISQSMQSVLSTLFIESKLFDYQHGIISKKVAGYSNKGRINDSLIENKTHLLLLGKSVKNILTSQINGNYIAKNSTIIGGEFGRVDTEQLNYRNILISLQYTDSHTEKGNLSIHKNIIELLQINKKQNLGFNFYIKNHPRDNKTINLDEYFKFKFVKKAPETLKDCFTICSIHITEYSSVTIDALFNNIPTIFLNTNHEYNFLEEEYHFPIQGNNAIELLSNLDENSYKELLKKQKEWLVNNFEEFNKETFLNTIEI